MWISSNMLTSNLILRISQKIIKEKESVFILMGAVSLRDNVKSREIETLLSTTPATFEVPRPLSDGKRQWTFFCDQLAVFASLS